MLNLIKKDFLVLSRSKSDLMELLLMPFLLISILGFALGNLAVTGFSTEPFPVAVVVEQSSQDALSRFDERLAERGLEGVERNQLLSIAERMDPSLELIRVLESEEVNEWVLPVDMSDRETADEALDNGEVSGIITVPEDFSVQVWERVLLNEEQVSELGLTLLNTQSVRGDILRSITSTFVDRFNLELSVALALDGGEESFQAEDTTYGEVVSLNAAEPISSFQYYTVGMGMMFALYTAPALSSRAFKEKEQHVFGRLMVSGTKPLNYLMSKLISGTWITYIQVALLFGLSTLIFGTFSGRDLTFWLNTAILTLVLAFVVGAIASLLTSIALYSNSDSASSTFNGLVVTLFAFLGGSFIPVGQFSESLKALGNWTPNGAMMTSYLQLMQGVSLEEISPLLIRVFVMAVLIGLLSVAVFPKRRLD